MQVNSGDKSYAQFFELILFWSGSGMLPEELDEVAQAGISKLKTHVRHV